MLIALEATNISFFLPNISNMLLLFNTDDLVRQSFPSNKSQNKYVLSLTIPSTDSLHPIYEIGRDVKSIRKKLMDGVETERLGLGTIELNCRICVSSRFWTIFTLAIKSNRDNTSTQKADTPLYITAIEKRETYGMRNVRLVTPLWFLLVWGCYDFTLPPRRDASIVDAASSKTEIGTEQEPVSTPNAGGAGGSGTMDAGVGMPGCTKVTCKGGCCDENNKCQTPAADASITFCGIGGSKCVQCALPHAKTKCDAEGNCVVASCERDFDNCDQNDENGCEADLTTKETCGKCHNKCTILLHAESSSCDKADGGYECGFQCKSGWDNCDHTSVTGCEADLNKDFNNCHECGIKCVGNQVCGARGCT